jgi:hypothetical protein
VSKRSGLIIGTLFAVVLLFGLANSSFAKSTECNTTISGQTVNGGLTVGPGDTCTVQNSTIHGGINQTGGTLTVCGSTVDGGVTSSGADQAVFGEINGANGDCPGDEINGHVTVSNGNTVEFDQDSINGGASLTNNTGSDFEVEGTHISGSVNCTGSEPILNDEGGPNSATGQVVNCTNF